MEQIGTVERVENGKAVVRVTRQSACNGRCHTCGGCAKSAVKAEAFNPIGAKPGDMVLVDTPTELVLIGTFLVYIMPVAAMFAGYYFFRIIGAVIGFLTPYLILHKMGWNVARPTIVKVVEK